MQYVFRVPAARSTAEGLACAGSPVRPFRSRTETWSRATREALLRELRTQVMESRAMEILGFEPDERCPLNGWPRVARGGQRERLAASTDRRMTRDELAHGSTKKTTRPKPHGGLVDHGRTENALRSAQRTPGISISTSRLRRVGLKQ